MRAHADECARAPAEGARASTEGARATTSQRAYGRARAPADERARVPTRGRASSSALARVCGLVRAHADEGAHMLTNSREHRPRARAPTRADEGTRIRPGARVRRLFFVGGESLTGAYTLATMSSEDTRATPPWRVALELFATILVWAGVWEVLSQIGAFHTVSRSLVIAGSGTLVLVILGYSRTPQEA